ncbi:hypothetical protein H483_0117885 [Dietzia sp. UCD-THP]|nr:hypothetical protein H483_0117885 [Dietzia sp. UCD-THP]
MCMGQEYDRSESVDAGDITVGEQTEGRGDRGGLLDEEDEEGCGAAEQGVGEGAAREPQRE